jgi:hypothetical protein
MSPRRRRFRDGENARGSREPHSNQVGEPGPTRLGPGQLAGPVTRPVTERPAALSTGRVAELVTRPLTGRLLEPVIAQSPLRRGSRSERCPQRGRRRRKTALFPARPAAIRGSDSPKQPLPGAALPWRQKVRFRASAAAMEGSASSKELKAGAALPWRQRVRFAA